MSSPDRALASAILLAAFAVGACTTTRIVQVAADGGAEAPAPESDEVDDPPPNAKLPDPLPPALDPSVPQARLVSSVPAAGAPAFYPVEIFDQGGGAGVGERRILRFSFDKVMDSSRKSIRLRPGGKTLEGTWSPGATSIEAHLLGSQDSAPLESMTEYEVNLDDLRSKDGEHVGTAHIRFTTAARDTLIDHACIHTLFGPFEALSAVAAGGPLPSAPLAGSTHKQYTLTIPAAGGAFEGDVRAMFSGTGIKKYALLLDAETTLAVTDSAGTSVTTTSASTVDACTGIRRRVDVTLTRGTAYRVHVAGARSTVKAIWETP